jgi:hypothetical protein
METLLQFPALVDPPGEVLSAVSNSLHDKPR